MNKHIKVLSLFSGIGAFEKALTRLGVSYEIVGYSEIDKYASKAYSLIHNISEDKNLGDITKINEKCLSKLDLVTYGFPCQSFSIAGKQLGINDPRGVLFFDALRIIREKQPKYAIAENVKNLVGEKFKAIFKHMIKELDHAGYNNYWKILNAKDFGIPQDRKRIFIVSIRKDIDKNFEFPDGFKNNIKLRDLLEDNVSEKFYLPQNKVQKLLQQLKENNKGKLLAVKKKDETFSCDTTRTKIIQIGLLDIKGNEQVRRVYNPDGLSPTLNTMQGGNRQPKIVIKYDNYYRIRRLTPLECWRLMGFDDKDFYKVKNGLNKYFYNGRDKSDSQLYKMVGNSIVVNVLEAIFSNLFYR